MSGGNRRYTRQQIYMLILGRVSVRGRVSCRKVKLTIKPELLEEKGIFYVGGSADGIFDQKPE